MIDTAEKRRSASQIISGIFASGVTPNSSKDIEWRQQSGWGYSGIAAGSPQLVVITGSMVFVAFGNNSTVIEQSNQNSIIQIGSNTTVASAR